MGWREIKAEQVYSQEDIEARLQEELPHWHYEGAGYAGSTRPMVGKAR